MDNIIVLKYGGTSVATPYRLKQVTEHILSYKKRGFKTVVIVSAMGSTTDYLENLAKSITPNPPKREMDMLLTTGERITMSLLSISIQSYGYKSISFTGSQVGIITTNNHQNARIEEIKGTRLIEALEDDYIVIVAGFQGVSKSKEITTLGRGGSDTTAVAIAAFLNATKCEIITDVNGIFSANPSIIKNAKNIKELSYEEAIEMASYGAQVLHPRAVEIAYKYNIPIHVKSLIKEGDGTMVKHIPIKEGPVVKALTYQTDLTLFELSDNTLSFSSILQEIAEKGIKINAFSQGKNNVATIIVEENVSDITEKTLKEFSAVNIKHNIQAISVIGNAVGSSEILNKTLKVLSRNNNRIVSISLSPLRLTIYIEHKKNINKTIEEIASELNLTEE